ncbi:glycosyltransferase [Oceanihabitans sediminis]|uniref:glycosyltransferase n=1 Tax=Oceanihabitans sediminis TaxID=1812012 RepID=UPI003A943195
MKVIYTGAFRFPDKDAASQRVLNIGKIFQKLGYEVIFFGWEKKERLQDISFEKKYFYENFQYVSQNELDQISSNLFSKLSNFIFRGDRTLENISNYIKNNDVKYIVAYNANSLFLYKLYKLAEKHDIKLICDCTEWYEPEHLPGGRYGLANFDNNYRIKRIYPLIKNVIVISSYLEKYLKHKGCNTLILPPLVDLEEEKWRFNLQRVGSTRDRIRLIYAGNPGKKDLLSPFFEALKTVNSQHHFELIILGSSEAYIKENYFKDQDIIPDYIKVNGRIPMSEVPSLYRTADYSILLREDKRYAHAGFPTKLVESLTCGVPLITNDTSDIKKYIKNGFNGFVLEGNSVIKIIACLKFLKQVTNDEIDTMKKNARQTSYENFDYSLYSNQFENYLDSLN